MYKYMSGFDLEVASVWNTWLKPRIYNSFVYLRSPSSEGLLPAPHSFLRYSTALLATLGLGVSLLLLNAVIFGLVIWRRPRSNQRKLVAQQHPQLQVSNPIVHKLGDNVNGERIILIPITFYENYILNIFNFYEFNFY